MGINIIKAQDIMTKSVVSMKKDVSAKDIAIQLVTGHFSGLPITDEKERIIGVVTEYDLLNKIREGKELETLSAEDVMEKNPVTVDIHLAVRDVLDIMLDQGILRIPVTDGLCLVGVISRSDILKTYVEQ